MVGNERFVSAHTSKKKKKNEKSPLHRCLAFLSLRRDMKDNNGRRGGGGDRQKKAF